MEKLITLNKLAILLITMAVLMPTALAKPQKFALVVGNNEGLPSQARLLFAEDDARKVVETLKTFGGFKRKNIIFLKNKRSKDLQRAFDQLKNKLKRVSSRKDTLLFFYYSGHSTPDKLQMNGTSYSFKKIKQFLKKAPATIRFAVLDSCYSGVISGTKGAHMIPLDNMGFSKKLDADGYAILTSSSANELSNENEKFSGSVFTHFLVRGLQGKADFSKDGQISIAELYHYTYNRTVAETKDRYLNEQHPTFNYNIKGRGNITLTEVTKKNSLIKLAKDLKGSVKIFNHSNNLILYSSKTSKRRKIPIHKGKFIIQVINKKEDSQGQTIVSVGKKDTIRLSNSDFIWQNLEAESSQTKGISLMPSFIKHASHSSFFLSYQGTESLFRLDEHNYFYNHHVQLGYSLGSRDWKLLTALGFTHESGTKYMANKDPFIEDELLDPYDLTFNVYSLSSRLSYRLFDITKSFHFLLSPELGVALLTQTFQAPYESEIDDSLSKQSYNYYGGLFGTLSLLAADWLTINTSLFYRINTIKIGSPLKRQALTTWGGEILLATPFSKE